MPDCAGDPIDVQLTHEPILPAQVESRAEDRAAGAIVTFTGVTRECHLGKTVQFLEYEAHEFLARQGLRELAADAQRRFALCRVCIVHRLGRLEVGEVSVCIAVSSAHRAAAFEACRFLIDSLKTTVPIFKKEHYTDGSSPEWVGPDGAPVTGALDGETGRREETAARGDGTAALRQELHANRKAVQSAIRHPKSAIVLRGSEMPSHFSVHKLHNGLTVAIEFMPHTVSTALGFLVQTGARYEEQRYDGVSHFLEHMLFKGTAKRTWLDINREFDEMGARYNAYTGWEETCYYAWVLNDQTPRAMDLLSDMLAPKLSESEFNTEKKVILEEIARYRDMPEHVAFEEAMKIAFHGGRLASNILGSQDSIGRLTRDEMHQYFQRRYVPSNITLVACGKVDEAALLSQVEQLWGSRSGPRIDNAPQPPDFQSGTKTVVRKDLVRQHTVLLWPALAIADRRSLAAMLLANVLGDDMNSRIYWSLRHTGLAEDAEASYWGFSDTGLIAAHVSCDPAHYGKVMSILRTEAGKLKKGIQEEELQRAKNRARTSLVFHAETPFNRFRQLMHQWSMRRELLTTEEMLARVAEVTLDDLYALLEKFPLDGEGASATLGPAAKTATALSAKLAPRAQPKRKPNPKPKPKPKPKAKPSLRAAKKAKSKRG
ncbi:MAG TPA: insulinase family protein [Planctomycetota bacterium]|jgi:predicted Zn-dependent peptidase/molybdopterin synthase catalytic subunit